MRSRKILKNFCSPLRIFLMKNREKTELLILSMMHNAVVGVDSSSGKMIYFKKLRGKPNDLLESQFSIFKLNISTDCLNIWSSHNKAETLMSGGLPCNVNAETRSPEKAIGFVSLAKKIGSINLETETVMWERDFTGTNTTVLGNWLSYNGEYWIPEVSAEDGIRLLKLESSNVVAVVTERTVGTVNRIEIELIEVEKNHTITTFTLTEEARKPVDLIFFENNILVSYWNQKLWRQELLSVEIFTRVLDESLVSLFKYRSSISGKMNPEAVNMHIPELLIFKKTYGLAFPGWKAMFVSQTARGITQKSLLLVTPSHQIYSVSSKIYSARRPVKPSLNASVYKFNFFDEGAPPYSYEIEFIPKETLTGSRQVPHLVEVRSVGTELESTSIVVGLGLDIFGTLIQPASNFDVVGKGVSEKGTYIILVVALALAVLTRNIAQKKELENKWK